MSDYNFIPDYASWWEKRDLSKEQMIWLMLGVNPDDIVRDKSCREKGRSVDESHWAGYFDHYLFNLKARHHYNKYARLLKSERKEEIFQEAYESNIEINKVFFQFLVGHGVIVQRADLENYKDHAIFEVKVVRNEAVNENYALARILNIDENYFDRFIRLDYGCEIEIEIDRIFSAGNEYQNHELDTIDLTTFADFSPEDKWFYSEYEKFISQYYNTNFCDITRFLRLIKSYKLWSGDFEKYCQKIHDEGFIFRNKTYQHLESLGIFLRYSESGWACAFYKDWIRRKLFWTVDEAAKLYLGFLSINGRKFEGFGEFQIGESGHGLLDSKTVVYFDKSGEWDTRTNSQLYRMWDDSIKGDFPNKVSLKEFVSTHLAISNLCPVRCNDENLSEFKPIDIVKFFREYCPNTYEPKALFQVLELNGDMGVVNNGTAKTHTGLAGRPSAKHLILGEFHRRRETGNTKEKISYESADLRAWLVSCHPDVLPPTVRVIENHIRSEYKEAKMH